VHKDTIYYVWMASPPNNVRTNQRIYTKLGTNIMPLKATLTLHFKFAATSNTNIMAVLTCEMGATLAPRLVSDCEITVR
jgi:hypothetical protein